MINIIILYHESVIQKICRKNDIFLCHFPTYYFTIYNYYLKLSYKEQIISKKKYESISKHLLEIKLMLKSWIESNEKSK